MLANRSAPTTTIDEQVRTVLMNNNTKARWIRTPLAKRREMANHGRKSKNPKVAFSAKLFCRKQS